jgi:hypothetical protein
MEQLRDNTRRLKMGNKRLWKAMIEMQEILKETCSETTVSVNISFSHTGFNTEIYERTAEGLRSDGITTMNLRGEFIK